ncbi:hypothetical protein D9758_015498 [Tetrapyrgos nigripes]|uniref:C2H2-type domain-containing protein n=1 Tax=Tetrapyrgos nigripes TaxID=182062 RepID=A0A8H5BYD1_9AGAR|nr:hypothetical protein D9758_015498 [Tetrapyrgos nigripes]
MTLRIYKTHVTDMMAPVNNGSDCHDCGGFEEFLQCCTDYHSYMSDPKAMNYQDWDPSLEQLLCACDQQQHSNQSHHHLHLHAQHANLSANFSLSPVDHSFPIPQPLPNVQNPAPISPISPTDSGYDFSSTLAPSIPSHLAEQAHTNNSVEQTLPISCMWGSCHARFSTSEELIAHVNSDHLKTSQTGASSPLSHSHPHEKQCNDKHTSKFSCLWRDCPMHRMTTSLSTSYLNISVIPGLISLLYPDFPQDYPKDYPTPPSEHSFPQNDSATFLSEGEAASPFGTPPPAYLDSCPQLQAPFDNLSVNSKGKDGETTRLPLARLQSVVCYF